MRHCAVSEHRRRGKIRASLFFLPPPPLPPRHPPASAPRGQGVLRRRPASSLKFFPLSTCFSSSASLLLKASSSHRSPSFGRVKWTALLSALSKTRIVSSDISPRAD